MRPADSISAESETEMSLEYAHLPCGCEQQQAVDRGLPHRPGALPEQAGEDLDVAWLASFMRAMRATRADGYQEGYIRGVHWGGICGAVCGALATACAFLLLHPTWLHS